MGFKGFLKKTLSVTGTVAAASAYLAYIAGKFVVKAIMDNGMSLANNSILDNLSKMDLTSEENSLVQSTKRLQDKVDRERRSNNDLVKKIETLEEIKKLHLEISELENTLLSPDTIGEDKESIMTDIVAKTESKMNLTVGEFATINNVKDVEKELKAAIQQVSEVSERYEEYNSDLKSNMKEIREIVRRKKEERDEDKN